MKTEKENIQMISTAEKLEDLMRVILEDSTARVVYDVEEEAFVFTSEVMSKSVNVRGDNARAAVYDFVNRTIGKLII